MCTTYFTTIWLQTDETIYNGAKCNGDKTIWLEGAKFTEGRSM